MANYKLKWDQDGERLFETNVHNGILAPIVKGKYLTPVAWNGLRSVTDSPDGAEETVLWADGIKYASMRSGENFGGTIGCYTYPPEWLPCLGLMEVATGGYVGQQTRQAFGFAYINDIGNDTDGLDYGEKFHVIYNSTTSPSEEENASINDSPEAKELSYTYASNTVPVSGAKATSEYIVSSLDVSAEVWKKLLEAFFGSETTEPKFLLPDEITEILKSGATGTSTTSQE